MGRISETNREIKRERARHNETKAKEGTEIYREGENYIDRDRERERERDGR